MKTDLYHQHHLGAEATPSPTPLSTTVPTEILALGERALRVADSEFSRGYHAGFEASEENREPDLWQSRIAGLIVGALVPLIVTGVLVATQTIVIKLG